MNRFKLLLDLFLPAISSDMKLVALRSIPFSLPKFTPEQIFSICANAAKIFAREQMVLDVYSPITVVGDIHGHILDLLHILNTCGMPPKTKYLFLGDIVDRGEFQIETLILILLLKLVYTDHVFLIRGNHEFDFQCQQCGFFSEVIAMFEEPSVYNACIEVFNNIPLAAKINNSFLCVHGGIGPSFKNIDYFYSIKRPLSDFGDDDIIDSVLWSDPSDDTDSFVPSNRGTGYFFGNSATSEFCEKNDIKMIIRGHECVNEGVEFRFDKKLVTVFSASNYCGLVGNKSAVLEILSTDNINPKQFPPLPYLRRTDAFFGVRQPSDPGSPSVRFHFQNPANVNQTPIPSFGRRAITNSLEALPILAQRHSEALPPLNHACGRRASMVQQPQLIKAVGASPRRRRKSNVF